MHERGNGGHTRRVPVVLPLSALTLALCLVAAATAPAATVGNAGIPVLWDTAWTLPVADESIIDSYLAVRARQGFDAVMTGMTTWEMANEPLGNGHRPFLGRKGEPTTGCGASVADVLQPNSDAFSHIDYIVSRAESLGLMVALVPGSNGRSGCYVDALSDITSENRAYRYGRYLGDRYKGFPNIIWVLGGDVGNITRHPALTPLTVMLKNGLRDGGALQKITFHPAGEDQDAGLSSAWFPPDGQWLDFNMLQWATDRNVWATIRRNYHLGKPTGLGEGVYDGDERYPALRVRAQVYQTFLGGGSYAVYGQLVTGRRPSGPCCGGPYTGLWTAGAAQSVLAKNVMVRREWQEYAPDETFIKWDHPMWVPELLGRAFQASGLIRVHREHSVAAIRGNSAAMVYLSTRYATVTVDMARLDGATSVKVSRFNPADGSVETVGTFGTSAPQTFGTGGLGDALLLFDPGEG